MSREAVLLQWERKIEAAERLDAAAQTAAEQAAAHDDSAEIAQPVPLRPVQDAEPPRTRRFARSVATPPEQSAADPEPSAPVPAPGPSPQSTGTATLAPQAVAERRTITITGRPTPAAARRRRAVVDSQLAQPDRIALWAFLLGLLLVAVAAGTAHA